MVPCGKVRGMDVVWLKKDVRLHDHAPLCEAARSGRPFVVLFLYEPEILQHHTVHGSHVHFQNEAAGKCNGTAVVPVRLII